MAKVIVKDMVLSLAWIKSGENTPHYYEVVLALKDPNTSSPTCMYVSFIFNSFDWMCVYLRSLARNYKVHSVDTLRTREFPAKVEYLENFNAPNTFKKLYINENNIVWPAENIHGNFKIDSLV